VDQEAVCGVDPKRQSQLQAEGWERRTVASEPRLSEVVEEYQALGFEVHLEPFDPSAKGEGGCTVCFDSPEVAGQFKTVYTRSGGQGGVDDLF